MERGFGISLCKRFSVVIPKPLRCISKTGITRGHTIATVETTPGNPGQSINGSRPRLSLIETSVTDTTRFRNHSGNTQG